MSEDAKKLIENIDKLFTDDINSNKKILTDYVIPYLSDNNYEIDDTLELFENCPLLYKTVDVVIKSNEGIISVDSVLYDAYLVIVGNDEIDYEKEMNEIEYYFKNKKSFGNDINYVTLYMLEISKYPLLSYGETKDKFIEYSSASGSEKEKIAEDIVNHNLRLVVSIAKKYKGCGVDFLDLVQAGNMGLCNAIDKYDYKKGYTLSTYATWWIKQSITRYIADNGRTIRIPKYMSEEIRKLKKLEKYLDNHDEYSLERLSELSGLSIEKILQIQKYGADISSLDEAVRNNDFDHDTTVGEMIPCYDEDLENVSDKLFLQNFKNEVLICGSLSIRQRKVLDLRYGLTDGKAKTLEEVGAYFNVTRERIRQIEHQALVKLRLYFKRRNYSREDLLSTGKDNYALTLK